MKNPFQLCVEVTNRCNGNCVYCAIRDARPEPTDLDFEVYRRVVDAFPQAREVVPVSFGEPLLYPRIAEAVEYARKKGKQVWLITNGSLLDEDMALALLDAGLNQLRISVDAADEKMHNKMRPGLDWGRIVENVERFAALRKGRHCSLLVRATLTDDNKHEAQDIVRFWTQRGCRVWLKEATWTPPLKMRHRYSSERALTCKRANGTFVVKANGDVALCCKDWWGWYISGNVYEQDPAEIFASKEHKAIRRAMAAGKSYPRICDFCHVGKRKVQ